MRALIVLALATAAEAFVPFSPSKLKLGRSAWGCRSNSQASVVSLSAAAQPTVLVVGSVNADIVVSVNRLPDPGETLAGSGGQVG